PLIPHPPTPTLFPYTTLFRSITGHGPGVLVLHGGLGGFDQGSWIAHALDLRAHRVIAVSRPGYLGTPDVGSLDAEADLYVAALRSEEHTSELQSRSDLVCRLL